MDKKGLYTCIFGGGAIRGIAYIGALKALKELKISVGTYAGSSVGSIVAAFLAVGFTVDEISDIFMQVNFELFRDIHFGLNKDFALSKGNVFTDWLKESIEKKFYGDKYKKGSNEPVKFSDLDKNLVLLTTDLSTYMPFEFSNFETPDFEIAEAVRISCSMPGLMTPVDYNNKKLVDGDLMKGIPLWKLSKNLNDPRTRVIEFRLEGKHIGELSNPFEYLNSIYSCMSSVSTDFIIDSFGKNDKYDYVKITTGDLILVDFNISQKNRNKLIEIGYNDSMKVLTQDLRQKKLQIIDVYNGLVRQLEHLYGLIKSDNVLESKECLKELFYYLSDKYMYVDSGIFEGLLSLKLDLQSAGVKRVWFNSVKFKERAFLSNSCEILKKVTQLKLDELKAYVYEIG